MTTQYPDNIYVKGFNGKYHLRPCFRGVGRFFLDDVVKWTSNKKTKIGTIIEVVPVGLYPTMVNVRGYWREYESYLIKANNKLYWPHVSLLKLIEKKGDRSKFEQDLYKYWQHTHEIYACNRAHGVLPLRVSEKSNK